MNETTLPWRPRTDAMTLRLDRAASIIRNTTNVGSFELTLTDDDRGELSALLEQASNEIAATPPLSDECES